MNAPKRPTPLGWDEQELTWYFNRDSDPHSLRSNYEASLYRRYLVLDPNDPALTCEAYRRARVEGASWAGSTGR